MDTPRQLEPKNSLENGFGLVEVIVSMFLLALLSVAFLPFLIGALQASIRNATVATASQLLNSQLDEVGTLDKTCAAFVSFGLETPPPVEDDRGTTYTAERSVTGCPAASFPAIVEIEIDVIVADQPNIRVGASTLAIVESAG